MRISFLDIIMGIGALLIFICIVIPLVYFYYNLGKEVYYYSEGIERLILLSIMICFPTGIILLAIGSFFKKTEGGKE